MALEIQAVVLKSDGDVHIQFFRTIGDDGCSPFGETLDCSVPRLFQKGTCIDGWMVVKRQHPERGDGDFGGGCLQNGLGFAIKRKRDVAMIQGKRGGKSGDGEESQQNG